jgi:hypothetical protein
MYPSASSVEFVSSNAKPQPPHWRPLCVSGLCLSGQQAHTSVCMPHQINKPFLVCPGIQVSEKEEARETYDEAVSAGHSAVLLEQDASMKDVFTAKLGNLPAGSQVTIRLTYVVQVPC